MTLEEEPLCTSTKWDIKEGLLLDELTGLGEGQLSSLGSGGDRHLQGNVLPQH